MMQGLGGLQSLIARGMRNPTQRAPIPPGMQALIQAQQALKQTAAPVTSGGIPTIAGQTEQAIQQHLQPAAPQMGEPQTQVLGQGIPQAAQMAGIAAQQQQAQQQQALQQAMQMAQQQSQPDQAQPMARGGIARLPADNMARMEQYAHGGVLGFAEEKLVPKPDDSDASKSETVETPNSQLETESTLVSPRSRFQSSGAPKGLTPEKIEQIKSDFKKELGVGASPGQYRRGAGGVPVALTEEEKAAATETALKKQRAGRESRQYTGEYQPSSSNLDTSPKSDFEKLRQLSAYTDVNRPSTFGTPSVSSSVSSSNKQPQVVQATKTPGTAAPSGLQALLQPNMLTPEQAIAKSQTSIGSADIEEQKGLIKKLYEMQEALPPTQQMVLDALRKGAEERAAMRAKAAEETPFNRLLRVLSGIGRGGIGGAGPAYLEFEQAQQAERAHQISEDELQAAKMGQIVEAQNNQKINALSNYTDKLGKTIEAKTHRDSAAANLAGSILNSQGHITSAQIAALANIYHTDKMAAVQAEANRGVKLEGLLRSYSANAEQVYKDIEAQLEKDFPLERRMPTDPDAFKDQKNVDRFNRYLTQRNNLLEERLKPITEARSRIESKLLGGPSEAGWGIKPLGSK